MTTLKEVIEKTENIQPLGQHNGVQVVSFEEQRDLAQLDKLNNRDLDTIQMNPDGTVARTPIRFAAVNVDNYFINRYKKVKNSIYVVTDYRAIQEQASGRVYAKQIPAYVISKDEEGNLQLDKMVNISDDEFIADFTHSLNREAMASLMPILTAGAEITQDDLPI